MADIVTAKKGGRPAHIADDTENLTGPTVPPVPDLAITQEQPHDLLREIEELWPRLSEDSARLVLRIVRSLAHYAV